MRKRLAALLLVMVCVIALTACTSAVPDNNGNKDNKDNTASNTSDDSDGLSEAARKFYDELDYEVYGTNVFAAITPVAGISFDFDTEKYAAISSEYHDGDTSLSVRFTQNGKIGSIILEYSPDFASYEGGKEEEVTINGMNAVIGTFEGSMIWDYIYFTGEYEGFRIENMSAEWLPDDNDEFMNILNTSLVLVNYSK